MNSRSVELLMERLRLQSILQRLKRTHGEDQALQVLREALELEFRSTNKKSQAVFTDI